LIGNASAHGIGPKTCSPSRGIFDKETRRKPLAFAADAAAMAIGRWFGTRSRRRIVGGVEGGSVWGAVSAGKVAAKALEIVSLRAFRGFWTDGCGGVRTALAGDHWNFGHRELRGGLEAQVPIYYFACGTGKHWHGKPVLLDAGQHRIDSFVVLAWVALVRLQPADSQYSTRSFCCSGARSY
jgi:hypothetical protein